MTQSLYLVRTSLFHWTCSLFFIVVMPTILPAYCLLVLFFSLSKVDTISNTKCYTSMDSMDDVDVWDRSSSSYGFIPIPSKRSSDSSSNFFISLLSSVLLLFVAPLVISMMTILFSMKEIRDRDLSRDGCLWRRKYICFCAVIILLMSSKSALKTMSN